ncbi:class I SAM-dependent methyltransferase [Candidatus Pelagibacter sp.]|nr:class I SAM-dependent methyltransferase [Candidatus Pelagibacter sp.]
MNNYFSKKIYRFFESKNVLKIKFLIQKYFKEKDIGNLNFNFTDKPDRVKIIKDIIELKNYKNYLEIGCFSNELFDQIKCQHKVGVDPISGGTIRATSDEFFKNNKNKFDCIFIDGLHKYQQVKKDILNSINFLNKGGIILLHDCLPNNVYEQAIPRCQYKWNGDVWKAIVEFRTYKNLDIYTCYADHGIGVIFVRPNKNQLSLDKKNFLDLRFKDYFENYNKYMNLISYSELIKLVKEN